MEEEIYAIDLHNEYVVYGGGNEEAMLLNHLTGDASALVDELGESIVFVKILDTKNLLFIVVTVEGMICLMGIDKSHQITELNESVSTCIFKNDRLVVGTEEGNVYVYTNELEHINTITCGEAIVELDLQGESVFALSGGRLSIGDAYGNVTSTLYFNGATKFYCINDKVFAVGTENKFYVYKGRTKLFEHELDGSIETIAFIDNSFIVGGEMEGILTVNINNFAMFKLEIETAVTNISVIGEYQLVFTTADCQVGLLDIRDKSTLKLQETTVETIFDWSHTIMDGIIYVAVCGEKGYQIVTESVL